MLSRAQLVRFGRDGYLVVPGVVGESLRKAIDDEVDALVRDEPPDADTRGKHFWFRAPSDLRASDAGLRRSPALELAHQLVAPHRLHHGFGHIQIALNIPPFDHRPEGPHLDGYHDPTRPHSFTMLAGVFLGDESAPDRGNLWVWPGSHRAHERLFVERGTDALMDAGGHATLVDPPLRLGEPVPVLGRRGDLLLAHYLLGHNSGSNLTETTRRMIYYRLSCDDHEARWRATFLDAFAEYEPVRRALSEDQRAAAWRPARNPNTMAGPSVPPGPP